MFTSSDYAQKLIFGVLDGLSILLNAVFIFAILKRTPTHMRPYSIFLLNNAIIDIGSAITSALATIRILNSPNGELVFVSLGQCSLISRSFCHLCHCIHSSLVPQSIIILFLSFSYRLIIIERDSLQRSINLNTLSIWGACLLSMAPGVLSAYSFFTLGEECESDVQHILGIEGYPSTCVPQVQGTQIVITLSYYSLGAPITMIFIFIVRRRLLARIASVDVSFRSHHSRIAQALTYQMMLPSFLTLGVSIWLLDLLDIQIKGEWSQRSVMGLYSVFALASPIINFVCLPPYRAMFSKPEATLSKVQPITILQQ